MNLIKSLRCKIFSFHCEDVDNRKTAFVGCSILTLERTEKGYVHKCHCSRDGLMQRCPTHSPLATCGEWRFKCGEYLYFKILQKLDVLYKIKKFNSYFTITN